MKELKLMVKGLFSGLSTLIWAMLLLLVFDYILILLLDEYGAVFVIPWVLCMMVITFGLFNLISAIYIENTLAAAKHQDESRKKEGLWVAQTTKRLLTKFCAAQQTINRGVELTNRKDFHSVLTESS